jgi:sugar/nucleoside kinase (ribokinase family)
MGEMTAPASAPIPRLIIVGELNADIIVAIDEPPQFGQVERVVPSTSIVLGSSSAITACGAARMGVPTSLVSVVGNDMLSNFLLGELRRHGLDLSAIRAHPTLPTGTSTILTLPDGQRSILTAMGTIGTATVADIPDEMLAQAGHVHVGSYFLQQALHPDLMAFFAACRTRGIATSVDPNDDPTGSYDAGIGMVLPEVDVFFCNADEALAISRSQGLDDAIGWFMSRLPDDAELVLKRGADGAQVSVARGGRRASFYEAPAPRTDAPLVDTVGAGDSLAAGYLASRLRGLPVPDRLRIGLLNGTASTRASGGTAGQLTWWDVAPPS